MNSAKLKDWMFRERFCNDGSPNRQSFTESVSPPTHPLYAPYSFNIVKFPVDKMDEYMFDGKHPEQTNLEDFGIPIHPDCSKILRPTFLSDYCNINADLICSPSSSPRTLFVINNYEHPYFLKLSYPMRLGRFAAPLTKVKAEFSLAVSNYIYKSLMELGSNLGWFRETGYVSANLFERRQESGETVCIFREINPVNIQNLIGNEYDVVPFFSLIAKSDTKSIEIVLNNGNGINILDLIWDRIIEPIIDSIFFFISELGLLPEPHAQNLVFLNISSHQTARSCHQYLAWRDALGFKSLTNNSKTSSAWLPEYRQVGDTNQEAIEISCCLDGMFDEYLLTPLLVKSRLFTDNTHILRLRTAEYINTWLSRTGTILPKDGWFYRDSTPIGTGQTLRVSYIRGKSGVR